MSQSDTILLTIITEASLESRLTQTLLSNGAKGYTVTDARGKGARGIRSGNWDADGNIRVEVICSAQAGESIAEAVQAQYYDHYAMVLYSHPVNVLRENKF